MLDKSENDNNKSTAQEKARHFHVLKQTLSWQILQMKADKISLERKIIRKLLDLMLFPLILLFSKKKLPDQLFRVVAENTMLQLPDFGK